MIDGGSKEERGGGEDLDFALDFYLFDKISMNIDDFGHQLLETLVAGDYYLLKEI